MQQNTTNININNIQASLVDIKNKLNTVKGHYIIKDHQRSQFSIDSKVDDKSCVIVANFKENISICQGQTQTSNDFFQRQQISVIGFALKYKINNIQKTDYYTYFSKTLEHDSFFLEIV